MPSGKYPANVGEVAAALKYRYHDFDHYNLKDPLDELLFIICSTKTGEASYRASFGALKAAFPTPGQLAQATAEYIARPIAGGGLSNQKSKAIRALLDAVVARFGAPVLEPLRAMGDRDAEAFLTALPGVGKKVARCVMMYALDRKVFPVDTHCWRIARRLGWVRATQKDRHCAPRDMDRLQSRIPPEFRYTLHVNMVSLGREICTASAPKCGACPVAAWCPKIGAARGRASKSARPAHAGSRRLADAPKPGGGKGRAATRRAAVTPAPLPPLIAALLDPSRYPHPAQRIELVETHASRVLLAGDFAYKIKKPVTLPFLDYGTLDKRRACCAAELRLNRRFAPDLYLGVVAIAGTPENPRFGQAGQATEAAGTAGAIEFAVLMRRFDEAGRLDRVCARGELAPAHISDLAGAVAAFHGAAATASAETPFASPAVVSGEAEENFAELASLLPGKAIRRRLEALRAWTGREFARLVPHFLARKAAGRVRECHGDLHLGNLVLIGGRVTPFDCIEFNDDFRWIDVASEIAFTYVDLLAHRQPGLAGWLLEEWLSRSGDYGAVPVLRFYAVYRALVCAKVAAIRCAQCRNDFSGALDTIALAEGLIVPPKPGITITHGLSGCGKTRASARLVLADPAAATLRLRSDVERKRLFGLAETARSGPAIDGGIYGQDANRRTYRRLLDLARQTLAAGWSVVVDAAFLKRAERDVFRALAAETGAGFSILAPRASDEQLRARIAARLAKGRDASEATLEVLERQRAWIEPLDEEERDFLLKYSPG